MGSNIKFFLSIARRKKLSLFSALLVMSVGILGVIAIYTYVSGEKSYDLWIEDHAKVFRLEFARDGVVVPGETIPFSPPALRATVPLADPNVTATTRISQTSLIPLIVGGDLRRTAVRFVDDNLLGFWGLDMVAGDVELALKTPEALVLSEREVHRLFGTIDPQEVIGRTVAGGSGSTALVVTGVFRTLPEQSHLVIDAIAPMNSPLSGFTDEVSGSWRTYNVYTYVKVTDEGGSASLSDALNSFLERNAPTFSEDQSTTLTMPVIDAMNVADIYLQSKGLGQMKPPGNDDLVNTFVLVSIFLTTIVLTNFAGFNYGILLERLPELGMRKVLGAKISNVFGQFLLEGALLTFLALILGFSLFELLLPYLREFLGVGLKHPLEVNFLYTSIFALGFVLLGGLASAIPACLLAKIRPADLLGNRAPRRSTAVRTSFITIQFFITAFLIYSALVTAKQAMFLGSMPRGMEVADRLSLRVSTSSGSAKSKALHDELNALPEVRSVGSSSSLLPIKFDFSVPVVRRGAAQNVRVDAIVADYDFASTMGITVLAGRWFDSSKSLDELHRREGRSRRYGGIVLSERASRLLGFDNNSDPIGETVYVEVGDRRTAAMTIIGVSKETHWRSAKESLTPSVYFIDPEKPHNTFIIHVNESFTSSLRAQIEATVRRVLGDSRASSFQLSSLQREFDELAAKERQRTSVFLALTSLTVVISCFGLVGLAIFAMNRYAKEIAIRKTFGARPITLHRLMLLRMLKPVLIGFVVSVPPAWLYNQSWLDSFANRISLGVVDVSVSGLALISISFATTFYVVWRTVLVPPATVFRQ